VPQTTPESRASPRVYLDDPESDSGGAWNFTGQLTGPGLLTDEACPRGQTR